MAVSSERSIAKQWALSDSAVHRHKTKHLKPAVARRAERREELGAEALLEKLQDLFDAAEDGMKAAQKNGDLTGLARCIKEARECLVRLGQATRGLWSTAPQTVIDARRQTVNIGQLSIEELRKLAQLAPATDDDGASWPSFPPRRVLRPQPEPLPASSSDGHGTPLEAP